jgi:hypothetical protein
MDAGLLLQYVIVGLTVVASAGFVVRRQFPAGLRRLRVACAVPLVREGRAAWLQRIGRWLAPPVMHGAKACGACNGCD